MALCKKGCKCKSCSKSKKVPTPKAKGQKGSAKPQSMRKRSAY